MQTPSKEPESSSMTHEEEEEMLHDISKLQDQVQQMSVSQKLTVAKINGMESKIKGVEAKMNGMEAKMDDWKTNMEELKINMNKLLQEMVTNGERVVKETHDDNKKM
jgi:chromosome segregation ATPase